MEAAVGSGPGDVSPHPTAEPRGATRFIAARLGSEAGRGWPEDPSVNPCGGRRSLWMVGRWLSLS